MASIDWNILIPNWDTVVEESYSCRYATEEDWVISPDDSTFEGQVIECIPSSLYTESENWVYIFSNFYIKELETINEEDESW